MDLDFLHKLKSNLVKHKQNYEDVVLKYQSFIEDDSEELCVDDDLDFEDADDLEDNDSDEDGLIVEEGDDLVFEDEELAESQHFFVKEMCKSFCASTPTTFTDHHKKKTVDLDTTPSLSNMCALNQMPSPIVTAPVNERVNKEPINIKKTQSIHTLVLKKNLLSKVQERELTNKENLVPRVPTITNSKSLKPQAQNLIKPKKDCLNNDDEIIILDNSDIIILNDSDDENLPENELNKPNKTPIDSFKPATKVVRDNLNIQNILSNSLSKSNQRVLSTSNQQTPAKVAKDNLNIQNILSNSLSKKESLKSNQKNVSNISVTPNKALNKVEHIQSRFRPIANESKMDQTSMNVSIRTPSKPMKSLNNSLVNSKSGPKPFDTFKSHRCRRSLIESFMSTDKQDSTRNASTSYSDIDSKTCENSDNSQGDINEMLAKAQLENTALENKLKAQRSLLEQKTKKNEINLSIRKDTSMDISSLKSKNTVETKPQQSLAKHPVKSNALEAQMDKKIKQKTVNKFLNRSKNINKESIIKMCKMEINSPMNIKSPAKLKVESSRANNLHYGSSSASEQEEESLTEVSLAQAQIENAALESRLKAQRLLLEERAKRRIEMSKKLESSCSENNETESFDSDISLSKVKTLKFIKKQSTIVVHSKKVSFQLDSCQTPLLKTNMNISEDVSIEIVENVGSKKIVKKTETEKNFPKENPPNVSKIRDCFSSSSSERQSLRTSTKNTKSTNESISKPSPKRVQSNLINDRKKQTSIQSSPFKNLKTNKLSEIFSPESKTYTKTRPSSTSKKKFNQLDELFSSESEDVLPTETRPSSTSKKKSNKLDELFSSESEDFLPSKKSPGKPLKDSFSSNNTNNLKRFRTRSFLDRSIENNKKLNTTEKTPNNINIEKEPSEPRNPDTKTPIIMKRNPSSTATGNKKNNTINFYNQSFLSMSSLHNNSRNNSLSEKNTSGITVTKSKSSRKAAAAACNFQNILLNMNTKR